jgi:Breast carcinoma amplified sequence 2 (BCAS2)
MSNTNILADPLKRGDGMELLSLAYVDEYSDMEEQVNSLILEEMQKFTPPNYLAEMPPIPPSILSKEIEQEVANRSLSEKLPRSNVLDLNIESIIPKNDNISSYEVSIENAKKMLEEYHLRQLNLELLELYGIENWKMHGAQSAKILSDARKRLENLKQRLDQVNLQRKSAQEPVGKRLSLLNKRYMNALSTNIELKGALVDLGHQVKRLRTLGEGMVDLEDVAFDKDEDVEVDADEDML